MKPPTCPTCQSDIGLVKLRYELSATMHPPKVYYRGHELALRPTAAAILIKLASAPYVAKDELRGSIVNDRTLHVHIVAIRHELPQRLELENDFGKGYRLTRKSYPLRYRRPRQPPEARTGQPSAH